MAAPSKALVCDRSLDGIAGSNQTVCIYVCLLGVLCVVQVEVSASGWWFVQRSPTECGLSACECKASILRRPSPTRGCRAIKKERTSIEILIYSTTTYLLRSEWNKRIIWGKNSIICFKYPILIEVCHLTVQLLQNISKYTKIPHAKYYKFLLQVSAIQSSLERSEIYR